MNDRHVGIIIAIVLLRDDLSRNSKEVCNLCRIENKEADKANRIWAAKARGLRAVTETRPVKPGAASRIREEARATNKIWAVGRAASKVIKATRGAAADPAGWAATTTRCSRPTISFYL